MARDGEIDQRQKLIELVDIKYPSPQDRANAIWGIIRSDKLLANMTDWDLLCFCVEYIAMQSQQFLFFQEPAKHLNNLLYTAHYYVHDNDAYKSTSITYPGSSGNGIGDKPFNTESREKSEGKSEINSDLIVEKGSNVG